MNTRRAALSFVALAIVSLAGAFVFLAWGQQLGGFGFLGATASIFLAMLSVTKVTALRRAMPVAAARPAARPELEEDDSAPAPLAPVRRLKEDEELLARLAALRAHRPRFEAPLLETDEPAADAGVEVIEGPPLEPEPSAMPAAMPVDDEAAEEEEEEATKLALRQVDELRAEIARLREGARKRPALGEAAATVSVAPPGFLDTPASASGHGDSRDPFARTEFSGLPGEASAGSAAPGEAFPRTEFSGLDAPSSPERGSFTKTEYLGPVELRKQ